MTPFSVDQPYSIPVPDRANRAIGWPAWRIEPGRAISVICSATYWTLPGIGAVEELEVDQRLPGVPVRDDGQDLDRAGGQDRSADGQRGVHALVSALPDRDEAKRVDVGRTGHRRRHQLELEFLANLRERWGMGVDVAHRVLRANPGALARLDPGRGLDHVRVGLREGAAGGVSGRVGRSGRG